MFTLLQRFQQLRQVGMGQVGVGNPRLMHPFWSHLCQGRGTASAVVPKHAPDTLDGDGEVSASGGLDHGDKEERAGWMRIARRIARSGIASRREAERLLASDFVSVNGTTINSPALNVGPNDIVRVNGKVLPSFQDHVPHLWMVHKLKGELVTRNDPKERPTLLGRLGKVGLPNTLMPVGRLDFNSEGLILLTNDGELARQLEHPMTGMVRKYSVRVHGKVTKEKLVGIRRGCVIDGVRYKGMGVQVATISERSGKVNTWLTIECTEGKNRQIRKICAHLYLKVNRLIRTRFGPFRMGKVKPGGVAKVALTADVLKQLDGINIKFKTEEAKARDKGKGAARDKARGPGGLNMELRERKETGVTGSNLSGANAANETAVAAEVQTGGARERRRIARGLLPRTAQE